MNQTYHLQQVGQSRLLGVDIGSTLTKFALLTADGQLHKKIFPTERWEHILEQIRVLKLQHVALTGGGAERMGLALEQEVHIVSEFTAFARGAELLLQIAEQPCDESCLVVSVGTGTSALKLSPQGVERAGGSALGGGTLVGLGRLLCQCQDFETLCELAQKGDRKKVDWLVSDIYPEGTSGLPGGLTAASFGRCALSDSNSADFTPQDIAHGLFGLVGENVALLSAAWAINAKVRQVILGGSTLRGNPILCDLLKAVLMLSGLQPVVLTDGEYAGAVGALQILKSELA